MDIYTENEVFIKNRAFLIREGFLIKGWVKFINEWKGDGQLRKWLTHFYKN
jgi:hypothetical protein